MLPRRLKRAAVAATAFVYLLPFGGQTQEAGADSGQRSNRFVSREEIVVTARKREESLLDVPLSVTAFTADQLQAVGAFNNEDVALLTPNFNTQTQTGRRLDRPIIRGMAGSSTDGEPNASYFIDGVFVSGSISTATLGPVERVEILRGPQSTQFGRATFSGAVNYVTRKPTDQFEGEVLTRLGTNDGDFRHSDSTLISAWASGPIIENKLRYFVSGAFDEYGGHWNNELLEGAAEPSAFPYLNPPQNADFSSIGGTQTKDVAGKLVWSPTDTWELTYKGSYTEGDDDHYTQLILENGELNCYLPVPGTRVDANGRIVDSGGTLAEDTDWFATSEGAFCGTFDEEAVHYVADNPFSPGGSLDFGPLGRPADGARRQVRLNLPDFRNGVQLNPAVAPFFDIDLVNNPEDISKLIADPVKPGTRRKQQRHLFESVDERDSGTVVARFALNRDELEQAFDLDHSEQRMFPGNLFNFFQERVARDYSMEVRYLSSPEKPVRFNAGTYWFESSIRSRQRSFVGPALGDFGDYRITDTQNISLFGGVEWDVSDALTLNLEARYAEDRKDINGSNGVPESLEIKSLTPRATLTWSVRDDLTTYLQIAKGNKPGDFNNAYFAFDVPTEVSQNAKDGNCAPNDIDNPPDAFLACSTIIDEETQWTYEVGVKSRWWDGRAQANLALFFIDWDNQSVFGTEVIYNDGITRKVATVGRNAGKSEIYGFELETVFLLTENIAANFSVGLTEAEFKRYNDAFYARVTGIDDPDLLNGGNAKGFRVPNSPKWSIISALSYDKPLTPDLSLIARTDYIYETSRFTQAANFTAIGRRQLWNARAGIDGGPWSMTVYINNILDDRTPSAVLSFIDLNHFWDNGENPGTYAGSPVPGRSAGLEVIVRFGNR